MYFYCILFQRSNQVTAEIPSPSTHSANSNTGTIRHRHKKSRPAPPPPIKIPTESEGKSVSEIYVGGTNSIRSQWRHKPILLITGYVKYSANVSLRTAYQTMEKFPITFVSK